MKPTITSKFALDTNILVYSHDNNGGIKQNIARDLIIRSPIVSTQVISEYINVLKGTQEDPCLISSKANKAISRRDKIWVENRMTFQQPESRQGRDMGENGNYILSLTGQGERGLVDFSTNMMSLPGQVAVASCLNLN